MTTPLVVGNWKMNGTQAVCVELARKIVDDLRKTTGDYRGRARPAVYALCQR